MTMTPTQREAAERLSNERMRVGGQLWGAEVVALLRELLAEPQSEPVAWRSKTRINNDFDSNWCLTSTEPPQTPRTIAIEPLYIHPPQQRKPLRRGVNGVCSRSTCLCERDGLGDECIWLRARGIGEAP